MAASSSCSHTAQHNTVGKPFIYYEITGHGLNSNNIILTDWVVHRTTDLAWPDLLTSRAQRCAEPGSCILALLLFGFHFPCSGLPRYPSSLASFQLGFSYPSPYFPNLCHVPGGLVHLFPMPQWCSSRIPPAACLAQKSLSHAGTAMPPQDMTSVKPFFLFFFF